MTLYRQNIQDALTELNAPSLSIKTLSPDPRWRRPGLRRRICQHIVLPNLVRREVEHARREGTVLVVHVLDQHYAHLLPGNGRGIVTCHDLDVLISKGSGLTKMDERLRARRLKRARTIHAISGHTAEDVKRFFPNKASSVVTNYYGIDPLFRQHAPPTNAPHLEKLRAAGAASFVLHVGSNIGRKNIPVLLRAFAKAKQQLSTHKLKLVKAGNDFAEDGFAQLLDELGITDDVIFLGNLNQQELVDVYNSCHLFAFPSRYEGFGRPVAEAQACGLPCVLARASSLPEVGGRAALYHSVDSTDEMSSQITSIFRDSNLRERIVAAGLENVRRFSWRRHAELLAESYLRSCSQNR
jgi:glycosyltransferase involved in cell wall biosynthesis